jgi:hypothetical protein
LEITYFRAMCAALSRSTDDVVKSRRTFASKMDEHSRETLHRMLAERANSAGYLSIDSGTVVHRSLCLVLHCATARPIVVSMVRSKTVHCVHRTLSRVSIQLWTCAPNSRSPSVLSSVKIAQMYRRQAPNAVAYRFVARHTVSS